MPRYINNFANNSAMSTDAYSFGMKIHNFHTELASLREDGKRLVIRKATWRLKFLSQTAVVTKRPFSIMPCIIRTEAGTTVTDLAEHNVQKVQEYLDLIVNKNFDYQILGEFSPKIIDFQSTVFIHAGSRTIDITKVLSKYVKQWTNTVKTDDAELYGMLLLMTGPNVAFQMKSTLVIDYDLYPAKVQF